MGKVEKELEQTELQKEIAELKKLIQLCMRKLKEFEKKCY
jgi:hypothetical protein